MQCLIDHLAIGRDDDGEASTRAQRRRRWRMIVACERTAGAIKRDDVPRMRSAAARALCQLARELQCRDTIRENGGIERLVAVVRNDDNRVEARGRDKAAQAIANMAARDDAAKIAIAAANAIPALVELLESHLDEVSRSRSACMIQPTGAPRSNAKLAVPHIGPAF